MRTYRLLPAVLVLLSCARIGYALEMYEIGPDNVRGHPTVEQPGWPAGMVKIPRHASRVYSVWCNGGEDFYFKATAAETNELVKLYSETRLRDHVVVIKKDMKEASAFGGAVSNVHFHFFGGIVLFMARRSETAETFDPTLTIFVDPAAEQTALKQITMPDNIIVKSEVAGWEVKSKATLPKRVFWYAQVNFGNKKPAADFEDGVATKVTLWEKGAESGISLGDVDQKGQFKAVFSGHEISELKTGKTWITLTVGNSMTAPKKDDTKLPVEQMSTDRLKVKAVEVAGLKFYFGRLLFDNGSPANLDTPLWPGAEISLTFPYAGKITLDKEGYFRVFFTPDQFEKAKAEPAGKNICIPDFGSKGRSTARYAFPAAKLSIDKATSGEVRIARPDVMGNKLE